MIRQDRINFLMARLRAAVLRGDKEATAYWMGRLQDYRGNPW